MYDEAPSTDLANTSGQYFEKLYTYLLALAIAGVAPAPHPPADAEQFGSDPTL